MFHDKGYNKTAEKTIIRERFTDFEYCIAKNDIDIENDTFKFFATGTDAVCIRSLFVGNKQIFVGKHDNLAGFLFNQRNNVCREDKMETSSLTVKNGTVIKSECKGLLVL